MNARITRRSGMHFQTSDPGGTLIENRTQPFENGASERCSVSTWNQGPSRSGRKLAYRWSFQRGAGSHGTVYLGDRFTVVKDLKKELGPGLLADMRKQLGIRKEDL